MTYNFEEDIQKPLRKTLKTQKFPTLEQRMDAFTPPFSSFLRSLYIEVANRCGEPYAIGELERLSSTQEEFSTNRASQAAAVSEKLRTMQTQEDYAVQWREQSAKAFLPSPEPRKHDRRHLDEPLGIIMGLLVMFTLGWIAGLIQSFIQSRGH